MTVNNKVFSWGDGSSGALGFGNKEDINMPRELKVNMNDALKVAKI